MLKPVKTVLARRNKKKKGNIIPLVSFGGLLGILSSTCNKSEQEVQLRWVLVVNFVAAMSDLVYNVETMHNLCQLLTASGNLS